MATRYSKLNRLGSGHDANQDQRNLQNIPLKSNMAGRGYDEWTQPPSSDGSFLNDNLGKTESNVQTRPIDLKHRTSSGLSIPTSIASAPWEHKLNEKHIREVPTNTETVRYFDPRRQTRRVFIDCLVMWFWTAAICAALAGTMYGFSTIVTGLTQLQKYAYNALITGLSIVLGLAFAAQFKQYAEMMRWRFLASEYRSLGDFEDVLGCDSYRSTMRILWTGRRKGAWYPSKAQLVAAFWLIVFVAFNVCAALLGLTYSIDVSDKFVFVSSGPVSVAQLQYISSEEQPNNGLNYGEEDQKAAANIWGIVGQNFDSYTDTIDDIWAPPNGAVYHNEAYDTWWYRFVDLSPEDGKTNVVTPRTVTSQATCEEYTVLYGGQAGFQTDNVTLQWLVQWEDNQGNFYSEIINNVAGGATTWMGNSTGDCGPRCAQILALQSADNDTITSPRMWACNNTVGQVSNFDQDGFANPELVKLPDKQAVYLAGGIGWSGVVTEDDPLEFVLFSGDTPFTYIGNVDADQVASLVMRFTVGALAAMDTFDGPRQNLTGTVSPSPAQVVNVKWWSAGAILVGIPAVQFVMLLGVVFFASKSIILEPSYMTAAHLLYPVIKKVGKDGCLFTVDEMEQRLGPNYKISYGVRPDPADPGHHDTTFVRDLDILEESEGLGYIRGRMPEGRYD